uniref:Nucleotide-diphospho-sugar transferase domain-containing protein n=1 Tax=viral metagenome TaxID=1070528 RepID=A0A6C0JIT1_9ZZZZ
MLYFLVYNDGNYIHYLNKLLSSVTQYGPEFKIVIFNKKDMDYEFVKKNENILSGTTGGGWWLWKPYIINNVLSKINENDIVFYLDSKYYFIENFKELYNEYMLKNDILVFKNKPNEPQYLMKHWCKMDVIQKYNIYNEVFNENCNICWAGAIIIKKTPNTVLYIKEWLDIAAVYENITLSPSKIKDHSEFIEHRCDQSLLSVVLIKNNIKTHFLEKRFLQNVRVPF